MPGIMSERTKEAFACMPRPRFSLKKAEERLERAKKELEAAEFHLKETRKRPAEDVEAAHKEMEDFRKYMKDFDLKQKEIPAGKYTSLVKEVIPTADGEIVKVEVLDFEPLKEPK